MSFDIVQVPCRLQNPRSRRHVSPDTVETPIVAPAQAVAYAQILLRLPWTSPYLFPASLLSTQQEEVVRKAGAEEEVFQHVHLFQEDKVEVGQHVLSIPRWSKVEG